MKRHVASSFNVAQAAKLLNKKETARDRLREKRIEEIVAVATKVFMQEGASSFSMRRVASLAGVTLSTLQHYFGKGENLLRITINSIIFSYSDRIRAIGQDAGRSARQRLDLVIDETLRLAEDKALVAYFYELFALASKDKGVAQPFQEVYIAYHRVVADLIAEINPTLTSERVEMIALMICAQIDGIGNFYYNRATPPILGTADQIAAAMKGFWLQEICRSASGVDGDAREGTGSTVPAYDQQDEAAIAARKIAATPVTRAVSMRQPRRKP